MLQKTKRPWGFFQILLHGKGWWFKRLSFKGGRTSLQRHQERDEMWVIYVPAGVKHRVGGRGDILELAIGNLREDDITRFADDYNRK